MRAATRSGRPCRLACLDIDSTLTGDPQTANEVRALLEQSGYVVVFVTSRTEEMILSEVFFEAAREQVDRRPPLLGREAERRRYVAPEEEVPQGLLDGDIIAGSSGTRILVKQLDGRYLPDFAYEGAYGVESAIWRDRTLQLAQALIARGGCQGGPAAIDLPGNYEAGLVDVAPPNYRIQLDFSTLQDKRCFLEELATVRSGNDAERAAWARSVRVTDDSKPATGLYKVFLTPREGSKARAAERIVGELARAARLPRRALNVFFAGDSFPDLGMGLFGGLGTEATLLLVGESRLVDALTGEGGSNFAGEDVSAIRRRLSPAGRVGYYRFRLPCANLGSRTVVIGDEAFPKTTAVDTVYEYLRQASG